MIRGSPSSRYSTTSGVSVMSQPGTSTKKVRGAPLRRTAYGTTDTVKAGETSTT